jgi:hypothetical protein
MNGREHSHKEIDQMKSAGAPTSANDWRDPLLQFRDLLTSGTPLEEWRDKVS